MRTQIFISYRREGGESLARVFYDRLVQDGYNVFLDVESLRSGPFNKALYAKIEEATDFLVILPPNALDRCNDPEDWVRLEIEHAFKTGKNIIPIMMRNFVFPETGLPKTLAKLPRQNGITANMEWFDDVYKKLKKRYLHSKAKRLPTAWRISGITMAFVLAGLILAGPLLADKKLPETPENAAAIPGQTAEDSWKKNVLMPNRNNTAIGLGGYRSDVEIMPIYGQEVTGNTIRAVKFLSSVEDAPKTSWDVSAAQDGSVMAWLEEGAYEMYTLYIAADGGINGKLACKDLFCGYANLMEVDFNGSFHTEDAVDMSRMFYGCRSLRELDLTGIQTTSAENFSEMFANCWNLEKLNVSTFDTGKAADMSGMFYNCNSLETLDITSFITDKVRNVSYMFADCPAKLDLKNFSVDSVMSAVNFMDDGVRINGENWLVWIGMDDPQPNTQIPRRTLTDTWDTGSLVLRFFSDTFARIELAGEALTNIQEGQKLLLNLYHDVVNNCGYEIEIKLKDGKLDCSGSYRVWGSWANSHFPESFNWWMEGDTLIMELTANAEEPASMYTLQSLQLQYSGEQFPIFSRMVSSPLAVVIFRHEESGEAPGAVITGLSQDMEPVWTRTCESGPEGSAKQIQEIGYINNWYYYLENGDLLILDGKTGDILRVIRDILPENGSGFTDSGVSADGRLFLCCYQDPWMIALTPDGTVQCQINGREDVEFWADDISVINDKAYIQHITDAETAVLEVDLSDYSYRFAG